LIICFLKSALQIFTEAGRSYFGFATDSGEIKFLMNTQNELSDSAGYFTIDYMVLIRKYDLLTFETLIPFPHNLILALSTCGW